MVTEFSEKRRSQRVPLTLPVKLKCPETLFHSYSSQGKTLDISYEGLCITIDNSDGFKVNQEIELKIKLYPGDFLLKAKGIVCWNHNVSDPDWPINVGVKITRMRHKGLWFERIEDKIIEAMVGKKRGVRSGGRETLFCIAVLFEDGWCKVF